MLMTMTETLFGGLLAVVLIFFVARHWAFPASGVPSWPGCFPFSLILPTPLATRRAAISWPSIWWYSWLPRLCWACSA